MIKSKTDLELYLNKDRIALKRKSITFKKRLMELVFPDLSYRFQVALRYSEYYFNKQKSWLEYIYFAYYFYKYKRLSLKCGFTIPLNVFGPGLAIVHIGTIVINPAARVGANCRLHVCTNIGASAGSDKAPIIGDNVYIAPGVKIYGDIRIANNVAFAANAAVHKNCEEEGMLYGGVPAKPISRIDNKKLIKHL